jgi:hypothetical protein
MLAGDSDYWNYWNYWKESPQAQELLALGLLIWKPAPIRLSTKHHSSLGVSPGGSSASLLELLASSRSCPYLDMLWRTQWLGCRLGCTSGSKQDVPTRLTNRPKCEDQGDPSGRPPSVSHALLMSGSPCGIAPPPCGPRSIVACLGVTAVAARALVCQDGKRPPFLCFGVSSRAVGCGSVGAISLLLSSCAVCCCGVWHQVATKPGVGWRGAGRTCCGVKVAGAGRGGGRVMGRVGGSGTGVSPGNAGERAGCVRAVGV